MATVTALGPGGARRRATSDTTVTITHRRPVAAAAAGTVTVLSRAAGVFSTYNSVVTVVA